MPDTRLLTYAEAAKLLNVPKGTLYAWVHERRIPHLRLSSRLVRFDEATLLQWLTDRQVTTTASTTTGTISGSTDLHSGRSSGIARMS